MPSPFIMYSDFDGTREQTFTDIDADDGVCQCEHTITRSLKSVSVRIPTRVYHLKASYI